MPASTRLVPPQTAADFKPGERVRYVPNHAFGDHHHFDCEDGVVSSVNEQYVFTRFGGSLHSQACDPTSLVKLL